MATAKKPAAKAVGGPVEPVAETLPVQDVDRVAMVSYDVDGNPAQTPGFVVIGE